MTIFKEGDVVSKKVGGPLMTVEETRIGDDFIAAVWFDSEGHVQRDSFAPLTLQKWQAVD